MGQEILTFGVPDGLANLEKGAYLDIPLAHWLLGNRYYYGDGLDQDFKKASDHYLRAAKGGLGLAARDYALMLEKRLVNSFEGKNASECLKWLFFAASTGDPLAQRMVGRALASGAWGSPDLKKASHYFRMASINGDVVATFYLAFIQAVGFAYPESSEAALKLLQKRTHGGHKESAYAVAMLFTSGLEQPCPDYRQAIPYLEQAADSGVSEAHRELGKILLQNTLDPSDQSRGIKHLHRAAEGGEGWAQSLLADAIMGGVGTFSDKQAAAVWYSRSRESGYLGAPWHWATSFHRQGLISETEAAEALEHTLIQGFYPAQKSLGELAVNAGKSLYQPDLLIRYLTFAALGSIPSAFLQLADHFFFQSLQQTEKNKAIDTGLFWLQAGVEACIPEVMHRFAEELISGTHTKKDLASALGLLNSAGSLGYIPSIKKMANLFHNVRRLSKLATSDFEN